MRGCGQTCVPPNLRVRVSVGRVCLWSKVLPHLHLKPAQLWGPCTPPPADFAAPDLSLPTGGAEAVLAAGPNTTHLRAFRDSGLETTTAYRLNSVSLLLCFEKP